MIVKQRNINLRPLNTFGISARCDLYVEFANAEQLREIFNDPEISSQPWSVLAGGSNIVFTKDYAGTLLHPVNRDITIVSRDDRNVRVRAGAGVEWDGFVQWAVDSGFWGIENLSYIPGMVGSAPVQNIGAYGIEVKDVIESVETYDVRSGKIVRISREHCGFGYRDSIFKRSLKGKAIILSADFLLGLAPSPKLEYGDINAKVEELGEPTLENIRKAVIEIRRAKLPEPEECGNAGSFFKNPVVGTETAARLKEIYPDMPVYPSGEEGAAKLAAGWLIDRSGWKGRSVRRVGVHPRQALVLVNLGGATGEEVISLAAAIQKDVNEKFGVWLEMEVNIL